jgi:hypothetical protein
LRARTGETRDTAVMGLVGDFLTDKFVPRSERIELFRTWGSGLGMLPIGGAHAWGNASSAPDDTPEMIARNITHGRAALGAAQGARGRPRTAAGVLGTAPHWRALVTDEPICLM